MNGCRYKDILFLQHQPFADTPYRGNLSHLSLCVLSFWSFIYSAAINRCSQAHFSILMRKVILEKKVNGLWCYRFFSLKRLEMDAGDRVFTFWTGKWDIAPESNRRIWLLSETHRVEGSRQYFAAQCRMFQCPMNWNKEMVNSLSWAENDICRDEADRDICYGWLTSVSSLLVGDRNGDIKTARMQYRWAMLLPLSVGALGDVFEVKCLALKYTHTHTRHI